jgi:hypothetical protein
MPSPSMSISTSDPSLSPRDLAHSAGMDTNRLDPILTSFLLLMRSNIVREVYII